MRRTSFADWDCSVAKATDILGDWWTPLVVRSALLGVRRFDDFVDMLGIPRNVLTERLNRLVGEGILERTAYSERPPRFEYGLTEKGRDLAIPVLALMQWGDRHFPNKPPRIARRRSDGSRIKAVLVDHDNNVVNPAEIEIVSGPGLSAAPA